MTRARRLALWTGLVAAPAAWTLHLWTGYALEEAACSPGSSRWFSGDHPAQIAAGAACLLLAAVGVAAALWTLAGLRRRELPDPRGRTLFLAAGGLASSAFFFAIVALAAAYAIVLDPCTGG